MASPKILEKLSGVIRIVFEYLPSGYLEGRNPTTWIKGGNPTSHTSAHDYIATVAPFRAWRSLQLVVARGPIGSPSTVNRKIMLSL